MYVIRLTKRASRDGQVLLEKWWLTCKIISAVLL
jgi:hypothetical protein